MRHRYDCGRKMTLLGGFVALISGLGWAAPAPRWTLTELGPGRGLSINGSGQMVCIGEDNVTSIISPNGSRKPLGVFEKGSMAVGVCIAQNGDVVGYSEGMRGRQAIRYVGGGWKSLAGLSGTSFATAIGAGGEVVGGSQQKSKRLQAFLWKSGHLLPLPIPSTGSSSANFVGPGGVVGGIVETAGGTHSMVISQGRLRDLGTLGGKNSVALGMNSRGEVVGSSEAADGEAHAFVCNAKGKMLDLGLPPGCNSSDARGIDERGRIAGNGVDKRGIGHPVVFLRVGNKGAVQILNLPTVDSAKRSYAGAHVSAIAPDGRMIGWGVPNKSNKTIKGGVVRCLLWTPTP